MASELFFFFCIIIYYRDFSVNLDQRSVLRRLYCLTLSLSRDSRHKWVNIIPDRGHDLKIKHSVLFFALSKVRLLVFIVAYSLSC